MTKPKINLRSPNFLGLGVFIVVVVFAISYLAGNTHNIFTAPTFTPLPTATKFPPGVPTWTPTAYPTAAYCCEHIDVRWFVGPGSNPDLPPPTDLQIGLLQTGLQAVDEFNIAPERDTDKIWLMVEPVPYSSAQETVAVEIAAGNGPDVIGPVDWLSANALRGEWMDLAPQLKHEHYNTSQFEPALLEMAHTDQGQVGLPFALYPATLEFNAALFDKAGLAHPPAAVGERYTLPDGSQVKWDWQALAQVARLLTLDASGRSATQPDFDAGSIVQSGFSWGHENHPVSLASFWQAGSELARKNSAGTYQAEIPAAWRAAWQWTYDGMHGPQPFILSGSAWPSAFESGRAAMTIETLRDLPSFGKVQTFQFAALPAYQGQVSRRLDVETFRIWRGTKVPDLAFIVFTYLLDQSPQKLFVGDTVTGSAYDALPARISDRPAFLEARKQQYPWVTSWDTLLAGITDPAAAIGEGSMPNFTEAWERMAVFGARLETTAGLDLAAETAILERDLTVIFNK